MLNEVVYSIPHLPCRSSFDLHGAEGVRDVPGANRPERKPHPWTAEQHHGTV